MQPSQTSRFKGLNNVSDPLRLGLNWLQRADDVLVTDGEALVRRDGYQRTVAATPHGVYATLDFTRLYLVNGGALQRVNPDMSLRTLRTGLAAQDMHWSEVNKNVFFTNGTDSGIILGDDSVIAWAWDFPSPPVLSAGSGSLRAGSYRVVCSFLMPDGRETGTSYQSAIALGDSSGLLISAIPQVAGMLTQVYIAPADSTVFGLAFQTANTAERWSGGPDSLGVEATTQMVNSLPRNAVYPTMWRGRMHVAQYMPSEDTSVVWFSEPLGFHLFDLDESFFMVPGRVAMLAPTQTGLVVGTDSKLYAYDGETITSLAEYGAVPGCSWAFDDDASVLFWSKRGLCRALPFENLTADQVSVAPGVAAGAAIVRRNGQKHFVVALRKGDTAFNHRGNPP